MNVYFVDPKFVKPEGWEPLLTYLKVKAAYSFIPANELPSRLYELIKPNLKAVFLNQDYKKFCDSCAFWLRGHFEKHMRLKSEETMNFQNEEQKKFSSRSAYNNIKYLDEENCLILLNLTSSYNERGVIQAPKCYVRELQQWNLPTHIASYCLNILHKKYGHNCYSDQSAFVCFDEYFSKAFNFIPEYKNWVKYTLNTTDGSSVNFMNPINRGINDLAPESFPLIEIDGRRRFTPLRSELGNEEFKQLLENAEERSIAYQEEVENERLSREDEDSWQDEVERMNREFWNECGMAGSNCESWPGYDY